MREEQPELTNKVFLCDEYGELNPEAAGWSRRPLHVCNLTGHFPRKKKWDYWCITGDRFLFSATIAHIDYISLGAIYFLEYETKRFAEKAAVKFLSSQPQMAETVESTEQFQQGNMHLRFEQTDGGIAMTIDTKKFLGKPFHASITISRPASMESLNVVVPWSRSRFQFTSKQECLPATGTLLWGDEELSFSPGAAFACLDFGRGIWPYRTAWNWASFSGHSGNNVVGVNMGAKWTDNTGANENGILLNGKMHKIHEDVLFEYDDTNFMRPWHMTTQFSDMVRLEFTPFYEKKGHANLLIINAETHQMFGHFSGTLRVDGNTILVDHLLGWAEEHKARW